jgi:hypothetical protein
MGRETERLFLPLDGGGLEVGVSVIVPLTLPHSSDGYILMSTRLSLVARERLFLPIDIGGMYSAKYTDLLSEVQVGKVRLGSHKGRGNYLESPSFPPLQDIALSLA